MLLLETTQIGICVWKRKSFDMSHSNNCILRLVCLSQVYAHLKRELLSIRQDSLKVRSTKTHTVMNDLTFDNIICYMDSSLSEKNKSH